MKIIDENAISETQKSLLKANVLDEQQTARLIVSGKITYEGVYKDTDENGKVYAPIHLTPTIPFENAIAKENIEGKTILTNQASGDALIWILGQNPEAVITFENNKLAPFLVELKLAAIKSLSYEDYIGFLYESENLLDYYLLSKMAPNLPRERIEFWRNNLIANFKKGQILKSDLFFHNIELEEIKEKNGQKEYLEAIKALIPFLKNEEEFLRAKESLMKATHIHHSIPYSQISHLGSTPIDTIFLNDWALLSPLATSFIEGDVREKAKRTLSPNGICIVTSKEEIPSGNVKRIGDIYKLAIQSKNN